MLCSIVTNFGTHPLESSENQTFDKKSEVKSSADDFTFDAVIVQKPVKVIGHKNVTDKIISAIKTQRSQPEYYPNFHKFIDHAFLLYGCAGKVILSKLFL